MGTSSHLALPLPDLNLIRNHVLISLSRYWPKGAAQVASLPFSKRQTLPRIEPPLRLVSVTLPDWAREDGVDGKILVPLEAFTRSGSEGKISWQNVQWFLAAFLLLECWHERVWEFRNGPIHSYSFRLRGWDARAWRHAWVNRMALFLRRWTAHNQNTTTEALFGRLPVSNVLMTHDVDAVEKTLAIRLKQGVFNGINAMRLLAKGRVKKSLQRLHQSMCFFFGHKDYSQTNQLLSPVASANIRGLFHFYADKRPKTFKRWLFDPSYDINTPRLQRLIRDLIEQGHAIGLHPGFETWQDASQISIQRARVEQAADVQVTHCRQHWLRFSWQATWAAQQSAGIKNDTTLMFNDRPGFRNSSALKWRPWHVQHESALNLLAMPSVFMDSHFYDYQTMSPVERQSAMQHWIQECKSVNGEAALLWHPHTLTTDYGWADGYQDAINLIKNSAHAKKKHPAT